MNINNDTNISNLITDSINKLNLNTKKPAQNPAPDNQEKRVQKEQTREVITDSKAQKQVDVSDIQKYASSVGETLTIDDINYGLMYGRSVIADYSV